MLSLILTLVSRVLLFIVALWLALALLGSVAGFVVAPVLDGAYGMAALPVLMVVLLHAAFSVPGDTMFGEVGSFLARALTFRAV